jgi:hypothetical protein
MRGKMLLNDTQARDCNLKRLFLLMIEIKFAPINK